MLMLLVLPMHAEGESLQGLAENNSNGAMNRKKIPEATQDGKMPEMPPWTSPTLG